MYEIAHREGVTAGDLASDLSLDKGYLSRLLKGFETKRLLARTAAPEDGRRQLLRLTPAGMRVLAPLEERSQEQVRQMLDTLDDERRRALLDAMDVIQGTLAGDSPAEQQPRITLRSHRPGDMGWVVQRHGEIYQHEYGWTEEFEALVAEIAAEFLRKLDPVRERCWIAQVDGRRAGSVFLVAKDATTAKLRLLLVEPDTRGLGIGRKLVAECVRFAREVGYQKIVLWTQENLTAARRIYSEFGFHQVAREPHHSFGHDLVGETWEMDLRDV
jgi:DNA-binding MarR family transcriptional regulator/GNAT superfamily N-acetyltransferase